MSIRNSILFLILLFCSAVVFAQYTAKGTASFYHERFNGRKTANGERYYSKELTAAHLSLPFNSIVEVKNLKNDKVVIVRINDRGPFVNSRIIDLSMAAADSLGFINAGLTPVEVRLIGFKEDTLEKQNSISRVKRWIVEKKIKALKKRDEHNEIPLTNGSQKSKLENQLVYGVQICSFSQKENMLRMSNRLKDKYIERFNVVEIYKEEKLFYRMILGEFENREQAEQLKSKIQQEFNGCFVVEY